MFNKFLITLMLLCIDLNLIFSQKSSNIVPAIVLEINKCSTSNILKESINLPNDLLRQPKQSTTINSSTEEIIEIRLKQSKKGLDCSNPETVEVKLTSLDENSTSLRPYFLSNGYMKYNETNFSPSEFCLESKSESSLQITVCLQKPICSTKAPCIRKCCEMNEVLDLSQFASDGKITCQRVKKPNAWTPHLYHDPYTKISSIPSNDVKINFISHHPRSFCEDGVLLMNLRPFHTMETVTPFRILENGSITEKIGRSNWKLVDSFSYCVDGVQNMPLEGVNGDSSLSGPFSGDENDTIVIDCRNFMFSDENEHTGNDKFTGAYIIALAIATIFLILTLVAHIILWKRQTIRGWTLMCYVTFLALEFVLLIVARLIQERGISCTMTGIGVHFTALTTFSWLTAMNFDVFWSFRTMNPSSSRKAQIKLFLLYAVFATLIPVCIVSTGLILENIYGEDPFSEVIVPGYGRIRCGLGPSAEFLYLFGPVSLLLGANLIFLSVTLFSVYRHKKILLSNGIKTQILNDKIRFFGMLFLVAGFTWIFDVISWATTPTNESTPWFWMCFDFINIFQAIAIFLIFVCNRTTLHHLQKEMPCLSNLKLWSQPGDVTNNFSPHEHNEFGQMDTSQPGRINRKLSITQIFSLNDNGKTDLELK